jgi:hypothetical protein
MTTCRNAYRHQLTFEICALLVCGGIKPLPINPLTRCWHSLLQMHVQRSICSQIRVRYGLFSTPIVKLSQSFRSYILELPLHFSCESMTGQCSYPLDGSD